MHPQTLTIETVTRTRGVRGVIIKSHTAATIHRAPYRLAKRWTYAHNVGLKYVRALGRPESDYGVHYVGVFDGQRRLLAAWKRMEIPGFTGTHERHPLLGGRSPFYRRNNAGK